MNPVNPMMPTAPDIYEAAMEAPQPQPAARSGSVLEAMLESIKGVIAKLFSGTVDGTTPPASYASTPQEQNIRRG